MKLLFGSGNLNCGLSITGYLKGGNARLGFRVNTMLFSSLAWEGSSSKSGGGVRSFLPVDVVTELFSEVFAEFLHEVHRLVHHEVRLVRCVSSSFGIDGGGAESPCLSMQSSFVYLDSV